MQVIWYVNVNMRYSGDQERDFSDVLLQTLGLRFTLVISDLIDQLDPRSSVLDRLS